ncbi:MAG: hypothetical protein ABIT01_08455, partial [Thermoanaerobaculia bacterium]
MRRSHLVMLCASLSAAVALASTVDWTDLTEADWLTSIAVRKAVVQGRTVHYPTPTQELAAALEAGTTGTDSGSVLIALRHLAEARRALGDSAGAETALEAWATKSGPQAGEAWSEAARWGARNRRWPFAFHAAAQAIPLLTDGARQRLLTERIAWAEAHPESADAREFQRERAALFPLEPAFIEEWIRSLEAAGRLDDAEKALASATALPEEKRVVVRSALKADHGDATAAYTLLETYVADPDHDPSGETLTLFAQRASLSAPSRIQAWRAELERGFAPRPLVLLERLFQGQNRGDLAFELLQQVTLRSEPSFDRRAWLLAARLWESIDAIPEAFRARLASAKGAMEAEKLEDLAALARLALKAGGRPLSWGSYNDEIYRWTARLDVTPGFLSGGLSLLLTGFERENALKELESRRLPERTFET